MKKFYLYIFIGFIIILFLFFLNISRYSTNKNKTNFGESITGSVIKTNSGESITGSGKEKITFDSIILSNDIEKCNLLKGSFKEICEDEINYNLGINKDSFDYCDKIINKTKKNSCIEIVSQKLLMRATKSSDCNNIKDIEIKNNCILRLKMDRPELITDINDCNIGASSYKEQCEDMFYFNQIKKAKSTNIEDCNKIKNNIIKSQCIYFVKSNISIGDKKNQIEELQKNGDSLGVVKKTCELNVIGNDLNNCIVKGYIDVGAKSGDTSVCNSLNDINNKNDCIKGINMVSAKTIFNEAYSKKDSTICNKINDTNLKNQCLSIVGK